MADIFSKEKRSNIMSLVKSVNTKPEILVRKALFSLGFRYRLHEKKMPGCPDIVLNRFKTIILVHGCFWHAHRNCKKAKLPKSNTEFWETKIAKNLLRDETNMHKLTQMGWNVLVIWECQIYTHRNDLEGYLRSLLKNVISTQIKNKN